MGGRSLPNNCQRNGIQRHPGHQTEAGHLGRHEASGDVTGNDGIVSPVQLPVVTGQCSSCHHHQLSRQRDLQTVLVALLDLFSSDCDLKCKD